MECNIMLKPEFPGYIKGFTDKLDMAQMTLLVFGMVENIVGKEENAGWNQHFHLFSQCFQMPSFRGSCRHRIVLKAIKSRAP